MGHSLAGNTPNFVWPLVVEENGILPLRETLMKKFALILLTLSSATALAKANFGECAEWIKSNTELRDAGARKGSGGMVSIGAGGEVLQIKPQQIGSSSVVGNRAVFLSRELPELQAIAVAPENQALRSSVPLRDEVAIERDSAGRVTKLTIARAINRFKYIQGTLYPAYQHIQDIAFAYDSDGCYPVSRTTYRKVADKQEPDASETFTLNRCAELEQLKQRIGYDNLSVGGVVRPVLRLPEEAQCQRLMTTLHQAEAPSGYSARALARNCSEKNFINTGRSRRDTIDQLVHSKGQCASVASFLSRTQATGDAPALAIGSVVSAE